MLTCWRIVRVFALTMLVGVLRGVSLTKAGVVEVYPRTPLAAATWSRLPRVFLRSEAMVWAGRHAGRKMLVQTWFSADNGGSKECKGHSIGVRWPGPRVNDKG